MATSTSVQPWNQPGLSAWRSAESYSVQAPNGTGDPTDWGVPHPPTQDTTVVPSMPAGQGVNPFSETIGYYGFESHVVNDTTPGPTPGAHGTAAMSTGTDWPSWEQEAGTRHQDDTGGSAKQYRELMPSYGVETGGNIRMMSTDNLNTRRPDGTFDSVDNGHLANDIVAPRNAVPDFGIYGRIDYSERPIWNNVATPAAQVTAQKGAFTPIGVSPLMMVQPAGISTENPGVPDPYVAPAPTGDFAFNPYGTVA